MKRVKKPKVLKNVISEQQQSVILEYINTHPQKKNHFNNAVGRKSADPRATFVDGESLPFEIYETLNKIVVDNFSSTALPSYFKWFRYSPQYGVPNLPPHLDDNACTYTIDIQLRSTVSWPMYVNGKEYEWKDRDALLYNGVDQLHWRPKFPGENYSDYVEVFIAHYAEPDHWFFDKTGVNPIRTTEYHGAYKEREHNMIKKYLHKSMSTYKKYV
jgi:hypothetical protein